MVGSSAPPAASALPPPPPPPTSSPPPPMAAVEPPLHEPVKWDVRLIVGAVLAVVIFVLLDWVLWWIVPLLHVSLPISGWGTTMYEMWIVIAIFAGAGYTLSPLRLYSAPWWIWRAAVGAFAGVAFYVLLVTQLWLYLDLFLPSGLPVTNWPASLVPYLDAMAFLVGACYALYLSGAFTAPWWGWRAAGGALRGIAAFLSVVWLPIYLIAYLQQHGQSLSAFPPAFAEYGTILAFLIGAAYALHPTIAYGPIEIGAGIAEIFYVIVLITAIPISFSFPILSSSVTITIGTWTIVLILVISIVIQIGSYALVTAEDVVHPGERRAWQYPPPYRAVSPTP